MFEIIHTESEKEFELRFLTAVEKSLDLRQYMTVINFICMHANTTIYKQQNNHAL